MGSVGCKEACMLSVTLVMITMHVGYNSIDASPAYMLA